MRFTNIDIEHKEKHTKKVHITLKDGESFFAKLFLGDGERIQDVVNDSRTFLPVEKHMQNRGRGNEDVWVTMLIHKEFIISVEER